MAMKYNKRTNDLYQEYSYDYRRSQIIFEGMPKSEQNKIENLRSKRKSLYKQDEEYFNEIQNLIKNIDRTNFNKSFADYQKKKAIIENKQKELDKKVNNLTNEILSIIAKHENKIVYQLKNNNNNMPTTTKKKTTKKAVAKKSTAKKPDNAPKITLSQARKSKTLLEQLSAKDKQLLASKDAKIKRLSRSGIFKVYAGVGMGSFDFTYGNEFEPNFKIVG